MSQYSQTVGPSVALWQEDEALRWALVDTIGEGKRREERRHEFDLNSISVGFSDKFLLALKELWIARRLQVKANSIAAEAFRIKAVLHACQERFAQACSHQKLTAVVFERVDRDLLLGLHAVQSDVPQIYIKTFRKFFDRHRHNRALFDPELRLSDFPSGLADDCDHLGTVGKTRQSVLSSALARATLVQILNITEAAFESKELSLGVFAFSRLVLSRAVRPESVRLLRLRDLRVDEVEGVKTYFLTITIPKAGTETPPHAPIRIHPDVGRLLERQREDVAKRLALLVDEKNKSLSAESLEESAQYTVGDLPLFPAGGTSGRIFKETKEQLGAIRVSSNVSQYYLEPIKKLTGIRLSHNAFRHTIGTQLAIAGCSAATIAAVLLHATSRTARVYVDLVFSGAINELSESMEPAFLAHFPVFSEFVSGNDEIEPARRVVSPSIDRLSHVITGECGRTQICNYAPLACYECPRFKPCFDIDHTVNLERVNEELASAREGGMPRQVDVERYTHIANRIRTVMVACEARKSALLGV